MEPTNIKVGEYVGVYHDSKDGSFHFVTISVKESVSLSTSVQGKASCER